MKNRTIIVIALVAVILANLTYLVGRFSHTPDVAYTARDTALRFDAPAYLAFIEEARQGAVLFRNLFTNEPQEPRFFHPLWLLLGRIAMMFRLSSVDVFMISRVVFGFFFVFLLGVLARRFFPEKKWGLVAFLLIILSSGVGGFFLPQGRNVFVGEEIAQRLSVEFWHTEINTFTSFMHSPLFIASQALLLVVFIAWSVWEKGRRRALGVAIGAMVLLGTIHPYDALIVGAVLGVRVAMLFRSLLFPRAVRAAFCIMVGGVLPLIGYLFLLGREIALAGWFAQNVTQITYPFWYVVGYGFLFPLAVFGMWDTRQREGVSRVFMTWILVVFALVVIPLQFQRRFLSGAHIPLVLFATAGIRMLSLRLRVRPLLRIAGTWVLVLGLFGTTFYLVGEQIFIIKEQSFPLYVPSQTMRAIVWIRDTTPRDATILAAPIVANLVPAFAGRRIYAGHGHQTINSFTKRTFLYQWFFPRNDDDRAKEFFFRNEGIDYLLWTPVEQQLGEFTPEGKAYLEEVYRNDGAYIYKFISVR